MQLHKTTDSACELNKKSWPDLSILQKLENFENKSTIDLLMKLRLAAIAGQLCVLWPALELGWLAKPYVVPYCLVVLVLALITLGTLYTSKSKLFPSNQSFVFFQLTIDTIALSILLKLTGGPQNPFISLVLFHATLGTLFLRGAWITFYVIFACWSLAFIHMHRPSVPSPLPIVSDSSILFPAQITILFLFVGLFSWANHLLEKQRRSLIQIREQKSQIDRLRAFGVVATGFSHEFATPIATLKLKLERLNKKSQLKNDPDLSLALEATSQAEKSLKSLMSRNILTDKSYFMPVEINSTLGDIFHIAASKFSKIQLQSPKQQLWIVAPKTSFVQMILDLVENSEKATGHQTNPVIVLTVKNDAQNVFLELTDSGPGFPNWIKEHLGTPFLSTRSEGSGLGLYHAYVLCQSMDGTFSVANRSTGGAIVSIILPRKQPSSET
jgi:two-component system sensor histidine kinase RegB